MKESVPVVLFRTDGSNEIGLGHIYRSIVLAKELIKVGCEIHFLTSESFSNLFGTIGTCHITNKKEQDEISLIKKINPDIFILDILEKFLDYSQTYFIEVRKISKLSIAIDYSSKNLNFFDQSFHFLFGPKQHMAKKTYYDLKYCIVNPEFVKQSKSYTVKKSISKILILRGGSDSNCIGPKIIKTLQKIDEDFTISIILGSKFDCWKELNQEKSKSQKKLRIFHNVKNMANIMKDYQLAISAAGVTSTELLTVGIPTIIIYGDPHEKEAANYFEQRNSVINLGYGKTISNSTIIKNVHDIMNDFGARKILSRNAKKNFDGKGGNRIAKKIMLEYKKNLRSIRS